MGDKKSNSFLCLLKWAGKDRKWIILSMLLSFISGLCVLVPYISIYNLMDAIFKNSCTKEYIVNNSLIIFISIIIRWTFFAGSGISSHKGAYGALYTVRCMIIDHMSKIPLGALSERSTGDIKTILNEDIEKLELFLAHNLPDMVSYIIGPLVILIYLLTKNILLALISLIPVIMAVSIMIVMFRNTDEMMERANKSISSLNSAIIEYISGMKIIKAYNMGSKSFNKFSNAIKEENDVWNKMSKKMGPPYSIFVIVIECGLVLMIPLGAILYMHGHITTSVLLLFSYVGSSYLTEIRPLQTLTSTFAEVLKAISKTEEILSIPIIEGGTEFPKKHDIKIKDVTFSYDGKINVLENCNLSIEDGEKIALVGLSGAGKSTIVELVSRFYDVDKGEITIGGKNVKEINYEQLLDNIAIVFQRVFLTRDSVFENIRMGSNATYEEVREASKKAQIDDFIMSLPNGYDTSVGGYGSRFSGGQKQRIAIARAILKNSPILILDEATSATDPENQVEIDKAISNLCEGKTVIIVAHRLSVLKTCDKIAIVENNTVSCVGKHDYLKKNNKYYNDIWQDYERARKITYSIKEGEVNANL